MVLPRRHDRRQRELSRPDVSAIDTVQATVGSVSGTATVTITNLPPNVAIPAASSASPVVGTSTTLSVLGEDDAGESNLSYTWATTAAPRPSTFRSTATTRQSRRRLPFAAAGIYDFTVTITDAGGFSTSSGVDVAVNQTATSIVVLPAAANLEAGGSQQFGATVLDQFGAAMAIQPALAWSSSVGAIDSSGLFTAPDNTTTGTVTAASGLLTGDASVAVNNLPPTVAAPASAGASAVTGTATTLSVLGADDAGESNLTYTWATTAAPAAVNFSANDSNAAKNTTATFTQAGSYDFTVTITDAGGLSTTSSVMVEVVQMLTSITVQPIGGLAADGTEPFAATAFDQFGNPLASPPPFTWSVIGNGQISSVGVFTPPYNAGTTTIQATSGSLTGSDVVTLPGDAQWNASSDTSWNTVSSWTNIAPGSTAGVPGLRGVTGDGVVLGAAGGAP